MNTNTNKEVVRKNDAEISTRRMTAIILAGGDSSRMRTHKALLPLFGASLIEKIIESLGGLFTEIVISARSKELYQFLPYPVVIDKAPGYGPLMGILCGLEVSSNPVNFVIACDIPDVNLNFLAGMASLTDDYEIVVPVTKDNKYEPLFAFYNKSLISRIQSLLDNNIRQVFQLYPMGTLKTVAMKEADWYYNLNTEADYNRYLKSKK